MAGERDVLETLVQQTVREVLFQGSPGGSVNQMPSAVVTGQACRGRSWTSEDAEDGNAAPQQARTSLLELLLTNGQGDGSSSGEKQQDDPAEEENAGANGGGDLLSATCRCTRVLACHKWPLKHLQAEKTSIKSYLQSQQQQQTKVSPGLYAVYEAYALLKLFILERDTAYRQAQERSSQSTEAFRTHLHVLLTLYASYFQRAYGRQIDSQEDVQPVQKLYALFLARRQPTDTH